MSDRPTVTAELDDAHARILHAAARLNAQARDDLLSAVAPSVRLDSPVSGTSGSSSTETGVAALRSAHDYRQVVGKFEYVAGQLEKLLEKLNPRPTGETCPSSAIDKDGELVRCTGEVTHSGHCWECHDFIERTHRYPEAGNLEDWNARRPSPCACNAVCCPEGCGDMVPASSPRRVSERCKARMRPDRRATREANAQAEQEAPQPHGPAGEPARVEQASDGTAAFGYHDRSA